MITTMNLIKRAEASVKTVLGMLGANINYALRHVSTIILTNIDHYQNQYENQYPSIRPTSTNSIPLLKRQYPLLEQTLTSTKTIKHESKPI